MPNDWSGRQAVCIARLGHDRVGNVARDDRGQLSAPSHEYDLGASLECGYADAQSGLREPVNDEGHYAHAVPRRG
jgi:hypothetical protein